MNILNTTALESNKRVKILRMKHSVNNCKFF